MGGPKKSRHIDPPDELKDDVKWGGNKNNKMLKVPIELTYLKFFII